MGIVVITEAVPSHGLARMLNASGRDGGSQSNRM